MADILIRGMEMPDNCFNCSTKIDPDNRRCNIDRHVFEETLSKLTCRRDENCPIIELPEHGDLIDRDAFMNDIQANDYPVNVYGNPASSGMSTSGIKRIVNSAPVVIPSNKETKNAD